MVKQLEFKCPECGQTELEEYTSDVNVYSIVEVYDDGSIELSSEDSGRVTFQDGNLVTYGCAYCNFRIYSNHEGINSPITDPEELAAWLKGRQ